MSDKPEVTVYLVGSSAKHALTFTDPFTESEDAEQVARADGLGVWRAVARVDPDSVEPVVSFGGPR